MQYILATGGKPFSDPDAATVKKALLAAELGPAVHLQVVPHPAGGFAIQCGQTGAAIVANLNSPREELLRSAPAIKRIASIHPADGAKRGQPASDTAAQSPTPHSGSSASDSKYPSVFRLSPAPRAFLTQHILAFIGILLLLQPHRVFSLTGIGVPNNASIGAFLFGLVSIAGVVLALVSLTRFLWAYTANTYVIDPFGVEQIQWYWDKGRLRRRAPRVNFIHLRTADVDQTMVQMILGVGTVRLAAGGTDTYEVELRNVLRPRRLQTEFQRRSRLASMSDKEQSL